MNNGTIQVKEQDLVLKVGDNVDISKWDETKYYKFIEELVGNREYQKDAILTALKFMCSGQYENTKQLAYENFNRNEDIRETYVTFENFEKKLNFTNYYTANLDLATGTGKSWVMYGIAAIMLASQKVDQVLVLVPSVTIEEELTRKFKQFAINDTLNNLLSGVAPKIINGSESITRGCICIENRDAIYNNSHSSIVDSLTGKGERTLVLSDEAHHIYYTEENQWKGFIEQINFKYNIGVSGTCYYKDNNYFSDVIYRYSLRNAIEENRVKSVEYVSEDNVPSKTEDRWKVILNSHEDIKSKISYLPLTLVVTANIPSCKKYAAEFKQFLKQKYNLTDEVVNEKVLIIHSKSDAALDRLKLKSVDTVDSKVEWIFSVSMLTEGWDVKRVFQIVPHEEKAFNSKLLIAQVLGRGLRVPDNWNTQQMGNPKVTVFNHAKWAPSVRKLVDEVLEYERKLSSDVIPNSQYNFDLLTVNYKPDKTVIKTKKEGVYNLFSRGYITLPTDSESETINANFIDINTNRNRTWSTTISHKTYSIDDMAKAMWYRFADVPDDNNEGLGRKYQEEWPVEKLKDIIKISLEKSGNTEITEKLKQKFLSALGVVFRQGNAVVDYRTMPDDYKIISTKDIRKNSVSASSLRREKVLFWTSNTKNYLIPEEKEFFEEVIDTTNSYRQFEVRNIYDFKTPVSAVIADSDPEKDFIRKLVTSNNTDIEKWIKSTSTSFYSIEYSWRKGEHPQRGSFNPDIFIKYKNRIIVLEIKGNEQINNPDAENIGKHRAARKHFKFINEYLEENNEDCRYIFSMITPASFQIFFDKLASGNLQEIDNFKSELDSAIEEKIYE